MIPFQIQWVDFGFIEIVKFEYLSTHIECADIPIQVKKCHLSNVILISERQTREARELCNQLICNELCGIYIHDNDDVQHYDSIACSVQSLNVPLDLSSLLISRGLVQHKSHSNRKFNEIGQVQVDSKRIRNQSDEPITKNSSELRNYEDFQEFYRAHKAKNSMDKTSESSFTNDNISDIENDEDGRIFEIFEPLPSRIPSCENLQENRTNAIATAAALHPIVDRISEHFKLMTMKRSVFHCRCACIIDPVTILIEPPDVKRPPIITDVEEQPKYFPLKGTKMLGE